MNYYKILRDGIIVDANNVFLRWQPRHKTMLACAPEQGQFIQATDQSIYRVPWLNPAPEEVAERYPLADAVEIDEEEFMALRAVLDSGGQPEEPASDEPAPETDPGLVLELEYLRQLKIAELSAACNAAIISGVDVALSDGLTHHFSLTVEDQLNLVSLSALILQGQTVIPYHADGEECSFFSAQEFQAVTTAATRWKTQQESYYNSLRAYVQSIDTPEELAAVEYGMDIPVEYQSSVLRTLLGGGDG